MYPVLFRIAGVEISTFGVMVALGAIAGLWLFGRELARSGLPAETLNAAVVAVLGGLLGAKLLYVAEHVGDAPTFELLTSRGGMSWFGGLAGGLLASVGMLVWRRWPLVPTLSAAAPAIALGHALGRIGCFLVGDDYGRPTSLPWGVAFPRGLPPTTVAVHPAQLYEAVFLAALALLLLRWRADRVSDRCVVARYLVLAGAARFAIELIRINPPVALGMTVAQWASLALVLAGLVLMLPAARPGRRARPQATELSVPPSHPAEQ